MQPMVNYRLINGKGQNGTDAIYMLYELSPATGQSFRDLGEARRNGRKFQFFPKPGLNLKSCAAPTLKKGRSGNGLVAIVEEQIGLMRASSRP